MAVDAGARGRGIGAAVLGCLERAAVRRGHDEVVLHAQAHALGFYERAGYLAEGERFAEAGIEHQAMRLTLDPPVASPRPAARPRGASQPLQDFEGLDATLEAMHTLIALARRELLIYTRDLEPVLYARPSIIEALKDFALSGRGGVVHFLLQDPDAAQRSLHPLLALAQRLPSSFVFRTPQEAEDMQYPSVYVVNDNDGYLFRLLGSRFEGDWSPALPGRNRQLVELFRRTWELARPCPELRALGL
jgi:hypothetical protein